MVWEGVGIRVGVGIGLQTSTLISFLYNVNNKTDRHINSNLHYEPNINISNNSYLKALYLRVEWAGEGDHRLPRKPTFHTRLLMTSALRPAAILDGLKATPSSSILKLLPAKVAFCQILLSIYFLFHSPLGGKVSEICSPVFPKRPRAR